MMPIRTITATAALLATTGCSTFSFAPPDVNLNTKTTFVESGYATKCMPKPATPAVTIDPTVDGAQALIDNYIQVYRCSAHRAADGRQVFEVPSLLVQIGTATALAFGAPSGYAIGGGAATGLLAGGNKYYSPQMKAAIFDHALDALLCIKTEALGVNPITLKNLSAPGTVRNAMMDPAAGVPVTPEQQYFGLIQASLFSVERVLSQRLSTIAPADAAGIIAQIEKIAADIKAKKDKAEGAAPAQAQTAVAGTRDVKSLSDTEKARIAAFTDTIIDIATLQPKLEQCVMRAKIA